MPKHIETFPAGTPTPHHNRPGVASHTIVAPQDQGWSGVALFEWSLTSAGWADHHPHDEFNLVLEGELHIESGGVTVVVGPGETVLVRAGHRGRYWAPHFARMIAVYGPNPTGESTPEAEYWELDSPAEPSPHTPQELIDTASEPQATSQRKR